MEKKTKKKSKFREIRSAVTMMCVMVAMMSTATYAWFSLTSNPVVNGLQMTAASSEGLKISENQTNWYNAVDLNDGIDDNTDTENYSPVKLYPATLTTTTLGTINSKSVPQFLMPVYDGFTVSDTKAIDNETDLANYVAKSTYYLKNESTVDANVGIITVDPKSVQDKTIGITSANNPNVEGSFAIISNSGDSDEADEMAIEAVRIAFVVTKADGTTEVAVYEPNYTTGLANGSTYATNGLTTPAVTPDVVSSYDTGKIMSLSDDTYTDTTTYTSGKLFTIPASQVATVEMYVWFEGQDEQCVDQIMADEIEVQIQFTSLTSSSN